MTSMNTAVLALILLSAASSAAAPGWLYNVGGSPARIVTDIASCDYDSDNKIEIAVATYSYDPADPLSSGGRVFVLTCNIFGFLVKDGWNCELAGGYQCLQWADVDGNGQQDLVVGSSVLLDEDRPVICFLNSPTGLSTTPIILLEGHMDVLDLEWGDFSFEENPDGARYPDLLVIRADDKPIIITGTSGSFGAWSLIADDTTHVVLDEIPPRMAMRASVWDVNQDGHLDVLLGGRGYLAECVSDPAAGRYSVTQAGKWRTAWIAVEYAPPAALSARPSILQGLSWDQGTMSLQASVLSDRVPFQDPDLLEQEFYVEFVSDIEFCSAVSRQNPARVAVSELGALGSPVSDPRNRSSQVFDLIPEGNNGWIARKCEDLGTSEAFCVEWCDIDRPVTTPLLPLEMTGSTNLFQIGSGGDPFIAAQPVYRVASAYATDQLGRQRDVHVWFSGNGWFGTMESLTSSETLHVNVLSSGSPDLFIGLRGSLIGYLE